MPHERINVQLAIKLDANGKLPSILYEKPSVAQLTTMSNMTWIEIIKEMIRRFKQYSENVKTSGIEENTLIAKRHICDHDNGSPFDACIEEDI